LSNNTALYGFFVLQTYMYKKNKGAA
jgi:hypothetical protein